MGTGKKFDDARSIEKTLIRDLDSHNKRLLDSHNKRLLDSLTGSENIKLEYQFDIYNIELSNSSLSADRLMNQCFNIDDYDVFISHSYKDIACARDLQEKLVSRGKTSFIDSNVWGNIYKIGDKYKVKYDASVVDRYLSVILAHSLTKVMAKAKKVIFIASSDSLTMNIDQLFNRTYSPWIFHELSMLNLLPSMAMQEAYTLSQENLNNKYDFSILQKDLNMTFNVELPEFIEDEIDFDEFLE